MASTLSFKTCPACGKEPVILRDGDGDDNFYIGRCPDPECELYNDDTFDDISACCENWNQKVAAWKAAHGGQQDEG